MQVKTKFEEEKEFYWKLKKFGTVAGMTYEEHWAERKMHEKRKNTKNAVKNNITKKGLDMFCTITFRDRMRRNKESLPLVRDSFRKVCKELSIDYVMMPELHGDGVSVHLHGFIRVDNKNLLQPKIYGQDHKKKGQPIIRNGRPIYTIPQFEKYFGFATLQYLTADVVSTQKQVNYMLKYALKSREVFEFKLMSSRPKKKVVTFGKVEKMFSGLITYAE